MGRLDGQVALVTGASRGFGRATAQRLAGEGAEVVVNYRSARDEADNLVREIKNAGGRAVAVRADVANHEDVISLVERVKADHGGLDILVNNAGVLDVRPFQEQSREQWEPMLGVNIDGVLDVTKSFLPVMIARGRGCIVNLASQLGHTGGANFAVYSGTKGFVLAYTRSLAREVGPLGIRINAVCPGSIVTDMNASIYPPDHERKRAQELPLRRMGDPSDIASAVLFLCTDDARFITGQCVDVNGGSTTV